MIDVSSSPYIYHQFFDYQSINLFFNLKKHGYIILSTRFGLLFVHNRYKTSVVDFQDTEFLLFTLNMSYNVQGRLGIQPTSAVLSQRSDRIMDVDWLPIELVCCYSGL